MLDAVAKSYYPRRAAIRHHEASYAGSNPSTYSLPWIACGLPGVSGQRSVGNGNRSSVTTGFGSMLNLSRSHTPRNMHNGSLTLHDMPSANLSLSAGDWGERSSAY